jgi:hypothetical protein
VEVVHAVLRQPASASAASIRSVSKKSQVSSVRSGRHDLEDHEVPPPGIAQQAGVRPQPPDGVLPDRRAGDVVRLVLPLAGLGEVARPDLSRAAANRRAADTDVVQNGIWLTALLGLDRASIRRSVARCEELAFADQGQNKP